LREETSQTLLENGTGGVGGLQTRELGYTEEKQEFSFKNSNGDFRHFSSREKLSSHVDAATSGAKILGYFPSNGMTSTDLQSAVDELRTMVAAGGSGTVLGTGTTGKIPKWSSGIGLTDSIMSEASSKLLFGGDSLANLYRGAAGILYTDGGILVAGTTELDGALVVGDLAAFTKQTIMGLTYAYDNSVLDLSSCVLIDPTVSKNNSNARHFYGQRIRPTFNAGGANAATIFDILSVDSLNTAVTGLTVNLMRLAFGGAERMRIDSVGRVNMVNGGYLTYWGVGDPDAADAELANVGWNGNVFIIQPTKLGSGTYRSIALLLGATIQHSFEANGNIGMRIASYGGGVGVLAIGNAGTNPTTNPVGGGVLYATGGALRWLGSSGTDTLLAAA